MKNRACQKGVGSVDGAQSIWTNAKNAKKLFVKSVDQVVVVTPRHLHIITKGSLLEITVQVAGLGDGYSSSVCGLSLNP